MTTETERLEEQVANLQQQVAFLQQELTKSLQREELLKRNNEARCQSMRANEQRYQRLIQAVTNYIYTVKIEHGQPVSTIHGPGCVNLTGYTSEEYDADPLLWHRMIYPDDRQRVLSHTAKILEGQQVPPIEHRIIHKDGTIRWIKNTPALHFDDYGQFIGYDGLITDITERKQAEQTLTEERALLAQRVAERTSELSIANAELSRAVRIKDEFLATMSHELRTPLNAILGFAEVLKDQTYGTLSKEQDEAVYVIEENGRRLLTLINDILDLSKIEAGKIELLRWPVAVDVVCRTSLQFIKDEADRKCINVSFKLNNALATIFADERRIKQILINLLNNAVKFTPEGGRVGLDVQEDTEQQIIRFIVWDTGIGISKEDMPQLFKPFVQLDSGITRLYGGTGLGLVLVYRMTEMHGGSVSVESEVGKGSQFTISLPLQVHHDNILGKSNIAQLSYQNDDVYPNQPTNQTVPMINLPTPVAMNEQGKTVLLIEDNETTVHVCTNYLRYAGYGVIVARNGLEGIERAREEHPDVIIVDMHMPVMDGYETIRYFRTDKEFATIPIIATSAIIRPYDREFCLKIGANEYLHKPMSLERLISVVKNYC